MHTRVSSEYNTTSGALLRGVVQKFCIIAAMVSDASVHDREVDDDGNLVNVENPMMEDEAEGKDEKQDEEEAAEETGTEKEESEGVQGGGEPSEVVE